MLRDIDGFLLLALKKSVLKNAALYHSDRFTKSIFFSTQ